MQSSKLNRSTGRIEGERVRGMIREFWSDIKNVERASAEDIQSDVLAYLGTIEELTGRIETAERQREEAVKAGLEQSIQHLRDIEDSNANLEQILANVERMENDLTEAIKALEWYGDEKNYEKKSDIPELAMVSAAWMDYGKLARTIIKRIKGATRAEGHQSTESAQSQAGGRKEGLDLFHE